MAQLVTHLGKAASQEFLALLHASGCDASIKRRAAERAILIAGNPANPSFHGTRMSNDWAALRQGRYAVRLGHYRLMWGFGKDGLDVAGDTPVFVALLERADIEYSRPTSPKGRGFGGGAKR